MLQFDKDLYKNIVENVHEGVYVVDIDRKITFWNRGAEIITGFMANEVIDRYCFDNILNHVSIEPNCQMCTSVCPLVKTLDIGVNMEHTAYLHHKDGHRIRVNLKSIPVKENGKIIGAIEFFKPTVDSKSNLESIDVTNDVNRLKILALYDQLTNLPNRRYLDNHLYAKYDDYQMYNIPFGVMFIDIDNFRTFNNTYGHEMGDKVLKMVAKTFANAVGDNPNNFVGRWGGEEFIIVFDASDIKTFTEACEKIRFLTECSIIREGKLSLNTTVSIGGTIVRPEDDVKSLINRADKAMYISKQSGKNRVTIN